MICEEALKVDLSLARALELFGDRWTLRVVCAVRDGVRRFDGLADRLGIARNVLSSRLAVLVDVEVLRKVPYREPGRRVRHEYELTERGATLLPVLLGFMSWADRYLAGEEQAPEPARHADCGAVVRLVPVCGRGHVVGKPEAVRLG